MRATPQTDAPRTQARYVFVPCHAETPSPYEVKENHRLYEALSRRLGDSLVRTTEPDGGEQAVFGRTDPARHLRRQPRLRYPRVEHCDLAYWHDPVFLAAAGRSITLCDFDEARRAVQALHDSGRDAFVKSTRQKLFARAVHQGTTLTSALGDLAYSVCDNGRCLLVQEHITLRDEYRIFVIAGRPVTGAGCIPERTPDDNIVPFDPTIRDQNGGEIRLDPQLVERYRRFAEDYCRRSMGSHYTLDLATSGPRIVCVEMNPLFLGRVGLFGCDLGALVDAVLDDAGLSEPHAMSGTRELLAV